MAVNDSDSHVAGGRLLRMARLAKVAARTTADVLAARAMQRVTGAEEIDIGETLKPTAERLVEVLGEMKGAATKLGQFVSLVDQDTFPEEARKTLHKLLNQTPQRMTWDQIRTAIRTELGQEPDALFAHFEREPLASASMGQVHAATTHDGRDVVVKVQFPGVDKAIESDLRNAGMMAKALSVAGGVFDSDHYYQEIAAVLRRELDYRQEIDQAEVYRQALAPWPDLVVPTYHRDLSSERVLTIQRLHGPTMLQAANDPAVDAQARFRIGRQLVAATWGPFLHHRVIHADPHPGNYIVLDDGRLGILDFGATKVLSVNFTFAYWQLIDAAFHRRQPQLYDILAGAGFDLQGERAKSEAWLTALMEVVERPFQQECYDWGACRIVADVVTLQRKFGLTALRVRAPEESLMFYRSAAGSAGDLRLLKATGNFRRVLMEVADVARASLAPEMAARLGDGFVVPMDLAGH